MTDDADDYPVGFKKPPKATKFKKGRSGNPKGRPKKSRNLRTDLKEELSESVLVKEGGKSLKLSKQRVMLKAVIAKAMRGDVPAIKALIELMARLLHIDVDDDQTAAITNEDQKILEDFLARQLKKRKGSDNLEAPEAPKDDKPSAAPDENEGGDDA